MQWESTGWFGDKEKRRWETDLVFLLSVGALGCLVYYMNRPSYHNLDCISLSAVLLAAYLAQYGMDFVRKNRLGKYRPQYFL